MSRGEESQNVARVPNAQVGQVLPVSSPLVHAVMTHDSWFMSLSLEP